MDLRLGFEMIFPDLRAREDIAPTALPLGPATRISDADLHPS